MIIKFSKYNEPFTEPCTPNVHYISLDNQRLMNSGMYVSHVECYYQNVPATFEAYDTIHGVKYIFESSKLPFSQIDSHSVVEATVSKHESKFLDALYFDSGIKAAGKRAGRTFTKNKNKGAFLCNW